MGVRASPEHARLIRVLFVLDALSEGGFDGAAAGYAFDTPLMFLFGSVLWQISRSDIERERLIRVAVAHPERTPRLVQNAEELGQRDPKQYFEHGLHTIITGLDARLNAGRP